MAAHTRVFPITLRRTFGALPEVIRCTWGPASDGTHPTIVQLYETYLGLPLKSPTRPDEKPPELPLIAFGAFDQLDRKGAGCRGSNLNPEGVHALALDYDSIETGQAQDVLRRAKVFSDTGLAHSTWNHGIKPGVRMRVVLLLPSPVSAHSWEVFWSAANQALGNLADTQCKNIDRFWYLPAINVQAPAWACDMKTGSPRVWFESWGVE